MTWAVRGLTLILVLSIGWYYLSRGTRGTEPPVEIYLDMKYQEKYWAQGPSRFFADGRAARTPVAGTVAFGGGNYFADAGSPKLDPDYLQADDGLYRGKQGKDFVKKLPVKVDMDLLRRGRERYGIHCAVCHGDLGDGKGITTLYGMVGVANLQDERLRKVADGEIYHVIVNGKGVMLPYGTQIGLKDRWAIVAYVRALQRARNARLEDVPPAQRAELEK